MNKERIKSELMKNFLKWYNTIYWNKKDAPEEKHLKQYLGYFGINKRDTPIKTHKENDLENNKDFMQTIRTIGDYNEGAKWDKEKNIIVVYNEGGYNATIIKKEDILKLSEELK